jgi:hypothetical protein
MIKDQIKKYFELLDVELAQNGSWDYVSCMCDLNKESAMEFLEDLSKSSYLRGDPVAVPAKMFLDCVSESETLS